MRDRIASVASTRKERNRLRSTTRRGRLGDNGDGSGIQGDVVEGRLERVSCPGNDAIWIVEFPMMEPLMASYR